MDYTKTHANKSLNSDDDSGNAT